MFAPEEAEIFKDYLFIHMSFYLYTCLSTRTHVFLPVHMSFYPYTCLSTCTRLSTCTHVFLPVHMSLYSKPKIVSTRNNQPFQLCNFSRALWVGSNKRYVLLLREVPSIK
jgi:hypothetical protein